MARPKMTDEQKAIAKAAREANKAAGIVPEKAAPKAERPPGSRSELSDAMKAALDFISPIDAGNCRVENGWLIATDGVLTLGHETNIEALHMAPETKTFRNALANSGKGWTITELGSKRLAIRSPGFSAFVPCLELDLVQPVYPDALQWPLADAEFRKAIAAVAPIAVESASRIVECSVLVRANSAVATDGKIISEAWHGQSFPTLVIPKRSIAHLLKIKKPIIGFGLGFDPFDPAKIISVTFHFEGNSWLKTQLYPEPWPDIDRLFEAGDVSKAVSISPDFFGALRRIIPFADPDVPKVYIAATELSTSITDNEGATVSYGGASNIAADDVHIINSKYLAMVELFAMYFGFDEDRIFLWGDGFRSIIMQLGD